MKAKHLIYIIASVLLVCASSCTKDYTGRAVRFRGMTAPGHSWTRTSYSGEVDDNEYERIDWVAGDKVKVNLKQGDLMENHVYTIEQVETGTGTNKRLSTAKFASEGGEGLQWHGSDVHDLWAAYPSTATTGDHTVTKNVPARQTQTYRTKSENIQYFDPDMSLALMTAGLRTEPKGDLELWFYPAVTTFDFTVGAMGNTLITKFEMETTQYDGSSMNVNLTGDAVVTYSTMSSSSQETLPAYSSGGTLGQTITAVFDKTVQIGVSDSDTSPKSQMNFKVFAIPATITGVRIKFYIDDGTATGSIRYLDLRNSTNVNGGAWLTFNPCVKYNIKGLLIPGAEWKITVDGPLEEEWIVHPDIQIGVPTSNQNQGN